MIVGIDFGTTNTRIAIWEPEVGGLPALKMPGLGMTTTMPSVIAFRRKPGGGAEIEAIGEAADGLDERTPTREVIRNIKRWALASDPFVRRALENMPSTPWPPFWNPEKGTMEPWGQSIAIDKIMMAIISEALKRVGLENISAQFRAGCPVHSDFIFRQNMVNISSRLKFVSRVTWVTDEPLLFLALAHSQEKLEEGSYLVYDFGGGSFDCAIADVERAEDTLYLTVYAADGDPLLGGMDIDDKLTTRLKYDGPKNLLRIAKEMVCSNPLGPSQDLPGGIKLSWSDVEAVLKHERLFERTLDVMMRVYRQAKTIWKRPPNGPPLGEFLDIDSNGVIKRTISQLREPDLANDIDKVLLFGGTTRISYIVQRLEDIFGAEKVVTASQLLPAFREPELTAVALGAAYPPREQYLPVYINRLPCRVTLHLRQASKSQATEYIPFELIQMSYESSMLKISRGESAEYEAIVEDADGDLLHTTGWQDCRMPGYYVYPKQVGIVIDRFGRMFLEMKTGRKDTPFCDRLVLQETPPWQTSAQRDALKRKLKMQREYEESRYARLMYELTHNPFRWGEGVG